MPLIAKSKRGIEFEPIPEDQHIGRCVMVADIGVHDGTFGPKHQCVIGWELPEVLRVFDAERGEEPAMLSSFYTVSLNEKANLRGMLESWRGRAFTAEELDGFDLSGVLGVACLLTVIHVKNGSGDTRAKVSQVTKLHRTMKCPEQILASRMFALDSSSYEDFTALPGWIQERIKESAEYGEWLNTTTGKTGKIGFDAGQPATDTPAAYVEAIGEADDDVPF